MNAQQRVDNAMRGGVPDCVPVIPQICYPHAIRFLGLDFRDTILDCIRHPERVSELHFECARAYGVDGVRIWPLVDPMEVDQIDGVWHGRDPETGKIKGVVDFQGGGWVIRPEEPQLMSDDEVAGIPVVTAQEILRNGTFDSLRGLIERAGDDLFVISAPGAFTVEFLTAQRGKQQALLDIIERPGLCHRIMERALAGAIHRGLALAKIGIDGLMIADVFGGVIGPALFAEFCLPYFQRFVAAMDAECGSQRPCIYLHICGNSTQILELTADTGVDCIEPLDCVGGVEVADAKRRVGDRVALMGGVSTIELAHGSLAVVKADIQRCLGEGAPDGGYTLACADMLPTETDPEKVHAMVEAAHSHIYT